MGVDEKDHIEVASGLYMGEIGITNVQAETGKCCGRCKAKSEVVRSRAPLYQLVAELSLLLHHHRARLSRPGDIAKYLGATMDQSKSTIPERYLDHPSQRLYILSLFLLCQVTHSPLHPFEFTERSMSDCEIY